MSVSDVSGSGSVSDGSGSGSGFGVGGLGFEGGDGLGGDGLGGVVGGVLGEVGLGVGSSVGGGGRVQVLVRCSVGERERWKLTAERLGVSVSELVRGLLNERAAGVLDCVHPVNMRRVYPWAESCLACGVRLRDGRRGRRG